MAEMNGHIAVIRNTYQNEKTDLEKIADSLEEFAKNSSALFERLDHLADVTSKMVKAFSDFHEVIVSMMERIIEEDKEESPWHPYFGPCGMLPDIGEEVLVRVKSAENVMAPILKTPRVAVYKGAIDGWFEIASGQYLDKLDEPLEVAFWKSII